MKNLRAKPKDLIDVYCKQIRSFLEFSAQVWHPNLTENDKKKIERVQKSACHIILGQNFKSYNSALKYLKIKTLFSRREKLCKKFAQKSAKNPKFSNWFKPNSKFSTTRSAKTKFMNVHARTERFKKNPVSFLTNILNHS